VSEQPFAPAEYALGAGRLAPLDPSAAGLLAERLAGMDPWRRLGYESSVLQRYLSGDSPALTRFRIDCDGVLAGVVAVRWPWLHGPYLELLAVLPDHQGRGIGSAVLRWLEAEGGASRNLWVAVSAFNEPARRFYARHGFVEIGTVPGLVRDGFDEILLRKALPSAGR
jgi:ribosomal protein S18 acetylase RimI-like enzyme